MPAGAKKDGAVIQASSSARMGGGLVAPPPGAVAAVGALPGIPTAGPGPGMMGPRTSIRFTSPAGMKISWYGPSPGLVEVPGRYNFPQGGIYRLKLTDIANRPGLELYPTLEVTPCTARSATFLAHSSVPITFTEEDFEHVAAGNFVVKVVYLPDPQFQDLAVAGPDEVISTRLEPGVDPILEAQRRGTILAVIRIGNIDLETANTPPMYGPPGAGSPFQGMPLMMPPGAVPPGMMPPGAMPSGQPLPMPGGAPPNAGRSSVTTPAAPPAVRIPEAPKPAGQVNASVEGFLGRTK
jgi:hypothetical protein